MTLFLREGFFRHSKYGQQHWVEGHYRLAVSRFSTPALIEVPHPALLELTCAPIPDAARCNGGEA